MTAIDSETQNQRVTIDVRLDRRRWSDHLAEETRAGLSDEPPWIPPVWFYDELGSDLFDQITRLPEYYPTDAERQILGNHAAEITRITGAEHLIELGSGTSEKTSLLLDALAENGLRRFVPFDCSEEILRSASDSIAAKRPEIDVHAVVGDFHEHLDALPMEGVTLLAFLGSTIGNFEPDQRRRFLTDVGNVLGSDDWLLLGTDLVKSEDRLTAAYDDAQGVTARFNLNSLDVMNAELGANFERDGFDHKAVWNQSESRIEMHLVARRDHRVTLNALDDLTVELADGDHIRTEISTKFTRDQIGTELNDAGLEVASSFTDNNEDFLVSLARPAQR